MKDPGPNAVLQQMTTEVYAGASAMSNSFEHVLPSKKKTLASQGVGAGVTSSVGDNVMTYEADDGKGVGFVFMTGNSVGSGVTGEGDGGSVLQIST